MLKKVKGGAGKRKAGGAYAIVASSYNARYVDSMLNAALQELKKSGAARVEVFRVPGAFEIPVVASKLAQGGRFSVLICLGVILRGATTHAEHIGDAVSRALVEIQIRDHVPVIHEVLLLENEGQAKQRCLDPKFNRGREAAQTAVSMAALMNSPVLRSV